MRRNQWAGLALVLLACPARADFLVNYAIDTYDSPKFVNVNGTYHFQFTGTSGQITLQPGTPQTVGLFDVATGFFDSSMTSSSTQTLFTGDDAASVTLNGIALTVDFPYSFDASTTFATFPTWLDGSPVTFDFGADGGVTVTPLGNGDHRRATFEFTPAVSAVPEPASLMLLDLGVAGLAGYGWRRRAA